MKEIKLPTKQKLIELAREYADEYCDYAKIKYKPVILSHHMLLGLKEGQEKAGIVVTATPNKNRFAKPTPVKFIIHFDPLVFSVKIYTGA